MHFIGFQQKIREYLQTRDFLTKSQEFYFFCLLSTNVAEIHSNQIKRKIKYSPTGMDVGGTIGGPLILGTATGAPIGRGIADTFGGDTMGGIANGSFTAIQNINFEPKLTLTL